MHNDSDNKNMIMFLIASMVLLFAYQVIFLDPVQKRDAAKRATTAAASASVAALPETKLKTLSRAEALNASPRLLINTPSLKGSLSLVGARIDDLSLVNYKETQKKDAPEVKLFEPLGTPHAYYAESGFAATNVLNLPGPQSLWSVIKGQTLGVDSPVILGYDTGNGLRFERTMSIDKDYMISVNDQIFNSSSQNITLKPYAQIVRVNLPFNKGNPAVHQGPIATWSKLNGATPIRGYITQGIKYQDIIKKEKKAQSSIGGWYGITDIYWLGAVIPSQSVNVDAVLKATVDDKKVPTFQSGYFAQDLVIVAGKDVVTTHQIFAGAKKNTLLAAYEKNFNIPRLDSAIDWGLVSFLTHPMNWLLEQLYKVMKNFGLAILALTVIVKLIFYPLAHSSYESMLKMKAVQQHLAPKLEAIKKKFPDDQQKQQQETMELYQREKINPMAGLSGCLPMLLQIPVFFALYQVLMISLDMRHAPFFGFITDLSAPDPTTIINLFGLLPFNPATIPLIGGILAGPLHIGIVAILYGFSMWLSQHMTPMAGIDEMQKKIFEFMPIIFTFVMAPYAIGLLVYWVWSNILTMLQQYSIMRRLKVDNIIDTTIEKVMTKLKPKPVL